MNDARQPSGEVVGMRDREPASSSGTPWGWILVGVGIVFVLVAAIMVLRRRDGGGAPQFAAPAPPRPQPLPALGQPMNAPVAPAVHRTWSLPVPDRKTQVLEPEERTPASGAPVGFAAWFHVVDGPPALAGQTHVLRRAGVTTIGRTDCHVLLEEINIRPRHCKIVIHERECALMAVPDGATVDVDGRAESTCLLRDGAIVKLGSVVLHFKVT